MDKYRSLSIGEPSIPWNQEWSPDGWNDWRFLRHVKHKGYTLRARVDDFNVFPSSFIYHMSWKYTFKKKIFQIFKQMGETQHCVLKVIIIIFFEVFLFLQEFLKERLWWFLALAEFLWKISKSKIKSVFLNKRMRWVNADICLWYDGNT